MIWRFDLSYILISDIIITSIYDIQQIFDKFNIHENKKEYLIELKCNFKLNENLMIANKFCIGDYHNYINDEVTILNFVENLFKNKSLLIQLIDHNNNHDVIKPYFYSNYIDVTPLKIKKSIKFFDTLNNAKNVIPNIENINNLLLAMPPNKNVSFSNLIISKLSSLVIILRSPFFEININTHYNKLSPLFYKFMSLDPMLNYKTNNLKVEALEKL